MANKMLIILTTGADDRGNRATLAFAMGVSSLISGVDTTIYMTMGGTFWSREEAHKKVAIEGFEPLRVYVQQFLDAGGRVLVCSPCDTFYCSIGHDSKRLPGSELAGLTHVVDLALDASVITL